MTDKKIDNMHLQWKSLKVYIDEFCNKIDFLLEKATTDYDFYRKLHKDVKDLIILIEKFDHFDGIERTSVIHEMQDFKFKLRRLQQDLEQNKPIDNAPWYKRVVRGIF
jgi:hypothetical protein